MAEENKKQTGEVNVMKNIEENLERGEEVAEEAMKEIEGTVNLKEEKKDRKSKEKTEEKKEEEKPLKEKEKKKAEEKPKKQEAKVKGIDLRISPKKAAALCKFIKGKKIDRVLEEMEMVAKKKTAIPIKGEYPHKKNIASGIYPFKAAKNFIKLLKQLKANSIVNGLDEDKTIIAIAKADIASKPYKSRSRRAKRTHILLITRERGGKK